MVTVNKTQQVQLRLTSGTEEVKGSIREVFDSTEVGIWVGKDKPITGRYVNEFKFRL